MSTLEARAHPFSLSAPPDAGVRPNEGNDRRKFAWAVLGLVLLTIVTRLPALVHPQAIDDEGVYSIVANEMVDGGRLYVDVVERKPPLLFWTYAAVFEATGKSNWVALHAAALLWTLATMAGLYVCARQLFNWQTGLIAALLYSIFQPWGTFKNLAFNGEFLMNLPLVWAWSIAFGRSWSRWRWELLGAGCLMCLAFLLKQPAALAALPLGLYLLSSTYRLTRGASRKVSLVHATMLTAGFFATLGLAILLLLHLGILSEAFYWVITNHTDLAPFWKKAFLHTLSFLGGCLPLVLAAICALRGDYWTDKPAERRALILLVALSAVGTAAGGRYYPHYYIQLIPPLALLGAPYLFRLWCRTAHRPPRSLPRALTMTWLALTVVAFSYLHWRGLAPERAPSETGTFIREHSQTDDRIFVWGHEPKVYLNSERRPASRYIVTFPLTGSLYAGPNRVDTTNRISDEAWRLLASDLEQHPPAFIVDLQANRNFQPVRKFPILANLLAQQYEPVAHPPEGLIYRRIGLGR